MFVFEKNGMMFEPVKGNLCDQLYNCNYGRGISKNLHFPLHNPLINFFYDGIIIHLNDELRRKETR